MIPIDAREVDILTFVTKKQLLGLTLSPAQRALLRSIYGLELTDEDREIWYQCTQREEYPGEPFTEVDAIFGTRGGKSSRVQAPCMLYEALFGGFEPNVGESMVIPIVAQDQHASRIVFRLIKDMLAQSAWLKPFVHSALKSTITLTNGIEIRAYPSTSRAIHGYSCPAGAMDEVARFRFEGAADSDADVESAILRGMTTYNRGESRALFIKASTPTSRSGVLYRDHQLAFGKADPHLLVWVAPSIVMNPVEVSPEHIAREMARDPVRARRLYMAEFSEDAGAFLSGEDIERAVQKGVREIAPSAIPPSAKVTFACDPSGGGADAMTLSGVMLETDASGRQRVTQLVQRAWTNTKGRAFDQEAVADEIAKVLRDYRVMVLYGDRWGSSLVVQAFERRRIEYVHPHIRIDGASIYVDRSRGYLEAGVLFRTGNITILDDDPTVAELRSLERRGDKVDAWNGHEDRANALCLAACMAVANAAHPSFPPIVWRWHRDFTSREPLGEPVDSRGTRHLGGGRFRAANGETFYDPRGL
jgi:hypothetical protein